MGFQEEIELWSQESKRDHPGHERAIDRVVTDFEERRRRGEFEGLGDLYMIEGEFLDAVARLFPKKIKARPERPRKQSRKGTSK